MTKVVLLKVADYQEGRVKEAVEESLELLGLGEDFFKEKKVLLKPNLLTSFSPERGACSHPAVVKAMAVAAQKAGGRVSLGDSPGFESLERVARAAGISAALQGLDVPLVSFDDQKTDIRFPTGRICKAFSLGAPVVQTELLVNLARLKTHSLTGYTGAVKNLYGCLSGHSKAGLHLRYHDIRDFSMMLADLAGLIRPALSLVDGIVSMEGPGPRRGTPRRTGFLVVSRDPVAADAVACTLVGIDPQEVLHLKYADEAGYGCAQVKSLEVLGNRLEDLRVKGFKKASTHMHSTGRIPKSLLRLFRDYYLPFPQVEKVKCRGCRVCMENCPPGIITMDKTAVIDYSRCIRCYCCQELCPHEAVDLKRRLRKPRRP